MPPRPLSATFDQPRSPPVLRKAAISKEDTDDRAHLTPAEKAWSAHQSYLEENGFVLRPRLRRGWKPSWQGTSDDPSYHEDSIRITKLGIVDATRTSDGAQVVLKAMRGQSVQDGSVGQPDELAILKYLHSPPYVGHACNHATPFLGSIPMPNTTEGNFGILPLLRMHNDPPLLRVGEAVEFMKQILRGLAFMHAQNVVHRDIKPSNIMMAGEALYDEPFHPVAQSLSLDAKSILRPRARHELDFHQPHDGESPVRYYFVNFSRASYLPPVTTDGQSKRMFLRSTRGQMGRFPEAMLTVGHDPFKADVYCMGKYVIDEMITRHLALAPFTPVARDMTRRDPRTRPTSAEAFAHFETIRGSLEPKYLNIPLDSKAHYIKPPLPIRSPRRAVSTTHLSARALRQPYSHASWSSTDSAHTLVAEIPPLPTKEVLKRPEPVSRAIFEVAVQEDKPVEAKKSKGKWGALCNAVKTMVR